jgi:hypothetical protein
MQIGIDNTAKKCYNKIYRCIGYIEKEIGMKKLLRGMLYACVALALTFIFVGCNKTPSQTVPPPPNSETVTPEKPDDKPDDKPEQELGIEDFKLPQKLATINIVTDDGQDVTGDIDNQEYKGCAVTVTDGREGENFSEARAQVRIRGNNTAEFPKKSFRLKFDVKLNLLGLNDGAKCKNWVLLACYKDVTFLRDAVAFELGRQTLAENGYYCSDFSYAEVCINGKYNGMYMVAEQQQVNKNRININEPEEGYTGTDIGYLVEYDGNAPRTEEREKWFQLIYKNYPLTCEDGSQFTPGQYRGAGFAYYTVKNDFYSTNQTTFIKNYTENVFKIIYDALYNDKFTTFNSYYTAIIDSEFTDSRQTIEAIMNVDSLVDTVIMSEVLCDNDIDFSSFFFTLDMGAGGDKKLTFQAPWDFDSGLGMMRGLERLDKIFSANVCTNAMQALNPWTAIMFKADWFRQEVAKRWAQLHEKGVFARLVTLVEKVTETYEPYFEKNYERWDNLGKIVDTVQGDAVATFKTHADASAFLKEWLTHRIEFLTGYFAKIS